MNDIVVQPKIIGVYSITCKANGRTYVGSSSDVQQRIYGHIAKLRSQKHPLKEMTADFGRHGEESFSFTIERSVPSIEEARAIEKEMISAHADSRLLYNTMFLAREVVRRVPQPDATQKSLLALQFSYRPLLAKWPSLKAFAEDIGITPDNARVIKLRDSLPPEYWLATEAAAIARGISGVDLRALATIEAGRNGFLDERQAA